MKRMLRLLFVFIFLGCSHFIRTGTEPIALRQQFFRVTLVVISFGDNFHCHAGDILRSCESKLLLTPGTCYSVCTSKHISASLFVKQSPKHKEANYCTNNLPLFGRLMTKQIISEVKIDKCKMDQTRVSKSYLLEYEMDSPLMYAGTKDMR